MITRFLVIGIALLGVSACDDSSGARQSSSMGGQSASGGDVSPMANPPLLVTGGEPMAQSLAPMAGVDADMSSPKPEPKYVETNLEPRQPLYTLTDTPQVVYVVRDRIARPIEGHPVKIRVFPEGAGQVDEEGRLSFNREGAGSVRVCATDALCGRVNFFVDDSVPKLVVDAPIRGAFLTGAPSIEVRGQTDSDGNTRIFVNDKEVDVDAEGKFVTSVSAQFGLNRIDVVADDGVRRPSLRSVREVLWAPQFLEPEGAKLNTGETLILRIDNDLFDSRTQAPEPDADGVVVTRDLATVLETLLANANLFSLIDDPQLSASDDLSFAVTALRTGQPDVSIVITDAGFEVFFRLDQADGTFTGRGFFAGEEVVLDGEITLSMAAFARFSVTTDDEFKLRLTLDDVGVAVERLSARMNSELAQAAVEGAASLARGVINQFGSDLLSGIIAEELAAVIEVGLGSALEPLQRISLSQDAQPPIPKIDLEIGLEPQAPQFVPRGYFQLGFTGTVGSNEPFDAPYMTLGIPAYEAGPEPPWPADASIAAAIRLVTLNGLVESLWRQGVLQLDLSDTVPMGLFGIMSARVDGRLPPVIVPGGAGSPRLLELQVGEIDLLVGTQDRDDQARYVLSLRAGLDLSIENGVIRSIAGDDLDVRVEFLDENGGDPPIPADLVATLVEGQIGDQLISSLSDALNIKLPSVSIGLDTLGDWVPNISRIDLNPSWPDAPQIRQGWLMLLADAEFRLVP